MPIFSKDVIKKTRDALKADAAGNAKCTMSDLDCACAILDEVVKGQCGFKYVSDGDDGESVYDASFPLPDDGTPGSGQSLRVSVTARVDGPSEIVLDVFTLGGSKMWNLGGFETKNMEALVRLLYGAARLVTVKSLQPV